MEQREIPYPEHKDAIIRMIASKGARFEDVEVWPAWPSPCIPCGSLARHVYFVYSDNLQGIWCFRHGWFPAQPGKEHGT